MYLYREKLLNYQRKKRSMPMTFVQSLLMLMLRAKDQGFCCLIPASPGYWQYACAVTAVINELEYECDGIV